MKKVILIILDGWGIAKDKKVSAIDKANKPFFDDLLKKHPNSKLEASGDAVGLPKGQMGNSEVGHMSLGAGRVIYQTFVRINKSIENKEFESLNNLLEIMDYVKKEKKNLHLIGLVSDGGVHSHINHLKSILSLASKKKIKNIFIHCLTDGRDCPPDTGVNFIEDLDEFTKKTTGKIASIGGRYFGMDRDKRWDRIEKFYNAILGKSKKKGLKKIDVINNSYSNNIYDEFIEPTSILDENNNPISKIEKRDAVVFFNFRSDRMKQMFEAFTNKNFNEFKTDYLDLKTLTMSDYGIPYSENKVLFEKIDLKNTIGEILEKNNKTQIRIAETEKYAHVTYFFSGGLEKEFKGEKRILCNSPKVSTYDTKPEMSALDITKSILPEIEKKTTDFICLNYANTDMVGHTGNMKAAIKAVETVDDCLKKIVPCAEKNNYTVIVLADHGNSDCMINKDNSPNTYHTTQPVPCILIDDDYKKIKDGALSNVAPTILNLMNLDIPKEMDCKSLL